METITLSPKARFCSDKRAASEHSDYMATPAFQSAAAAAMLSYQYKVCPSEPTVLAISASKLKGAQEFLRELMNIGIPETHESSPNDEGRLVPPEESLDRPYEPPKKK